MNGTSPMDVCLLISGEDDSVERPVCSSNLTELSQPVTNNYLPYRQPILHAVSEAFPNKEEVSIALDRFIQAASSLESTMGLSVLLTCLLLLPNDSGDNDLCPIYTPWVNNALEKTIHVH